MTNADGRKPILWLSAKTMILSLGLNLMTCIACIACIAFIAITVHLALIKSKKQAKSSSEKQLRQNGQNRKWSLPDAQSFRTISSTDAPKFRPFRYGDYKVTMGIRFIPETQWFELYKSYPAYIRLRQLRHSGQGKECCDIVPHPTQRNTLAALEAARSISAYLSARYPDLFQLELCQGAKDAGNFGENVRAVKRLECKDGINLPYKRWLLPDLDDTAALKSKQTDPANYNPMAVAGELVPDDLALLLPDDDAIPDERGALQYRFIAGSICTAGFWRLRDKLNCTLQEIHTSGKVPQFAERLRDPLDRFFTKMEAGSGRLSERNNYFFQVVRKEDSIDKVYQLRDGTLIPDVLNETKLPINESHLDDRTELTWGISTNGPEHLYDASTKGPIEDAGPIQVDSTSGPVNLSTPIRKSQDVVMRTERQTLRKLPKSGAVLFTIHTHLVPIEVMAKEPGIPGRLAYAMRHWPDDVAWYKAATLYRDVVLPFLDKAHQDQIRSGIVLSQEIEEEKSKKSYPF